jgi:hypothetical protein
LLKLKVAQKVAIILGYFIFSKNHNEPLKVTPLAKNRPIWSPWLAEASATQRKSFIVLPPE